MKPTWKQSTLAKLFAAVLAIVLLFATGMTMLGVLCAGEWSFYYPGSMYKGQFLMVNANIQSTLSEIKRTAPSELRMLTMEEEKRKRVALTLQAFEDSLSIENTNLRFACYDESFQCFWTNDPELPKSNDGTLPNWGDFTLDYTVDVDTMTLSTKEYQVQKHFDTYDELSHCQMDSLTDQPEDYENWYYTNDIIALANSNGFTIEKNVTKYNTSLVFESMEEAVAYDYHGDYGSSNLTVTFSERPGTGMDDKVDVTANIQIYTKEQETVDIEEYFAAVGAQEEWTICDPALAEALKDGLDVTVNAAKVTKGKITTVCYLPRVLRVDDNIRSAWAFFQWLYQMRFVLIILVFAFALLSVLACTALCTTAGHVRGRDDIVCGWLHRRPYELFCVLPLAFVFLGGVIYTAEDNTSMFFYLIVFCLIFCTAAASVLWLYTTAVRIKNRSFWRSFLVVRIFLFFFHLLRKQWLICFATVAALFAFFCLNVIALPEVGWAGRLLILELDIAAAVFLCYCIYCINALYQNVRNMVDGDFSVPKYPIPLWSVFGRFARALNCMTSGIHQVVEKQTKAERMRSELITNVSHDLKTPLTSIVTYIDLLKREPTASENAAAYLEVLERQSNRLKKLTEDLVEASKASTGSLTVDLQPTNVSVLIEQLAGEYEEKLATRQLSLVVTMPERPVQILADGKLLCRVFDNLLGNAFKYSMPGTRIYLNGTVEHDAVRLTLKNISNLPLNLTPDDLTERFVRGDASRSTEGSGLGLSIAKDLTALQHGSLYLEIDGDLFKANVVFPILQSPIVPPKPPIHPPKPPVQPRIPTAVVPTIPPTADASMAVPMLPQHESGKFS